MFFLVIFSEFNNNAFNEIQRYLSHIPRKKLSQWAIAWSVLAGVVDVTVVGSKNKDQLLSNIASLNYVLKDLDKNQIIDNKIN